MTERSIAYWKSEMEIMKMERTQVRLWCACALLFVLFIITNVLWLLEVMA